MNVNVHGPIHSKLVIIQIAILLLEFSKLEGAL